MSLKALRKALKNSNRDGFPNGTVIRWVAAGRFDYAAIKAGPAGQWYTTATSRNPITAQVVSWEGLLKILQSSETSEVRVASDWTAVTD